MLAVQASVDVAGHLIADQRWPPANDLADSFHRLHEHDVISRNLAQALARAVGLRNIVAHLYAQADPELVHQAATTGVDDLERFSHAIAAWLRAGSLKWLTNRRSPPRPRQSDFGTRFRLFWVEDARAPFCVRC